MTPRFSLPLGLLALLTFTGGGALAQSAPTLVDSLFYMQEMGYMRPDGDGSLRPDAPVTRMELVEMLMARVYPQESFGRCFEELAPSLPVKYTLLFADVHKDAAYGRTLCSAMVVGLVDGNPDGSFRPGQTVDFATAAKLISRAFGLHQVGRDDPAHFPWYLQYTDPLHFNGLVPATVDVPWHVMTRGEVAQLFHALRNNAVSLEKDPLHAAELIRRANPVAAETPVVAPAPQEAPAAPPSHVLGGKAAQRAAARAEKRGITL